MPDHDRHNPWPTYQGARALGCRACEYFKGRFAAGSGVNPVCERDPDRVLVVGLPREGCAYWMRAIGADD